MIDVNGVFTGRERPTKIDGFAATGTTVIIDSATVGTKKVHIAYYETSVLQIQEGTFRLVEGAGDVDVVMPWRFDVGLIIPYKKIILAAGNELKIINTFTNGLNYELYFWLDN